MKQIFLGVAVLALAACGGGGGITPPGPTPTVKPPISYTSKLVFDGALAGHTVQADIRQVQIATDAATPIPIMVVEPPVANKDTSVYAGDLQVVVSPMPSAVPSVSVSQTDSGATIVSTPSPGPGQTPQPLPTGVIAQVQVNGANVVQTQSAGTASATVGAPINETPSAPVYSYMSIEPSCLTGMISPGGLQPAYAHHFGWQWTGTTWAPDDDVSSADVYMDGPNCTAQNPSESGPIIHIPGGDVRISTDTPFNSITASQWSNAETSYDPNATGLVNPDGSFQCVVIGKTRDESHVFKWFAANAGCLFGAIETSGTSVDGF